MGRPSKQSVAAAAPKQKEAARARTKRLKPVIQGQDEANRSEYEIRSVSKALDLLEAICGDDNGDVPANEEEIRVTRLSRRLGTSKSAVFRLLATFENRGYVERIADTGIYRIGMNAFVVGRKLLSRMGLLQLSRPVMEDLCRRCNEAVYLAIRRGSDFLFIDLVESAQQVKITPLVGKCFPLPSAAPGRVILAYSDPPAIPVQELFPNDLPVIREKGFCHEQGGLGEMVGCLAAPFFNSLGSIAGAICVVGPSFRMAELQIESSFWPLLKDASEAISSKLGYLQPYAGKLRL